MKIIRKMQGKKWVARAISDQREHERTHPEPYDERQRATAIFQRYQRYIATGEEAVNGGTDLSIPRAD